MGIDGRLAQELWKSCCGGEAGGGGEAIATDGEARAGGVHRALGAWVGGKAPAHALNGDDPDLSDVEGFAGGGAAAALGGAAAAAALGGTTR